VNCGIFHTIIVLNAHILGNSGCENVELFIFEKNVLPKPKKFFIKKMASNYVSKMCEL